MVKRKVPSTDSIDYFACCNNDMKGGIPMKNDYVEAHPRTSLGLFDNYPLGTLLAVAWEGGGAAGTLASISKGIVTLGGYGLITLGTLTIPVLAGNFITIRLDEIVAVAPIESVPIV